MKFQKIIVVAIFFAIFITSFFYLRQKNKEEQEAFTTLPKSSYWLLLRRKSNIEELYYGQVGRSEKSQLIRKFKVKSGVTGESPTPLPELWGRQYWRIIDKVEAKDNPETAPYFLTLDIPVSEEEPYGPTPYLECDGQCNWILPGYFGLHGVNGDLTKLSDEDLGSSGCIRHNDVDVTYLYNLLPP